MQGQAQNLTSLLRTIILVAVIALLIMSSALPTAAQNSNSPTAVQAAKSPQFATRLAHPAGRLAPPPRPAGARQGFRGGPPQGNDIYDNGPINGNTDAWGINFGFIVSDTISVNGTASGMSFGAWLSPGDTVTSAELSITSEPNGGTVFFDQTVSFSQESCTANQLGYNVCTESTTFNGPTLNGTYWVNLQNASVPSGDQVYWDENSGVGCESTGCPSQADANNVGTIPSESFTMLGSGGGPICFGSGGNLQVIANFTQQEAGPYGQDGVVIDRAGNLYGAFPNGGNDGAGFAFKLSRFASSWVLDPLFNFFGGNTGGEPANMIIGPNGSLYGGAQGGIQNCGSDGSQYCGLVYNLTPQPTACRTSLCSWNENVPYRFSSESDGSGAINVSTYDQEGNLYGTTTTGGTHDAGTVFELMSSRGSWTKTILYSFTGGPDGGAPGQVLFGHDGNLYGVAGGIYGNGIVFQLTHSGGGWTESVLHSFGTYTNPGYLLQDSAGNLYGILTEFMHVNVIFTLQKNGLGWSYSEYDISNGDDSGMLNNLAIDTTGRLYGTGGGGPTLSSGRRNKSPGAGPGFAYIFEAAYSSGGWNFEQPYNVENVNFPAGGSLALDSSGNLYGTTSGCGTYGYGTVWQLSP